MQKEIGLLYNACLYFVVFYDLSENVSYSLKSTSLIYEILFLSNEGLKKYVQHDNKGQHSASSMTKKMGRIN